MACEKRTLKSIRLDAEKLVLAVNQELGYQELRLAALEIANRISHALAVLDEQPAKELRHD
jgi:hypothetical protein